MKMGQSICFQIVVTWTIGDRESKMSEEQGPVSLVRIAAFSIIL